MIPVKRILILVVVLILLVSSTSALAISKTSIPYSGQVGPGHVNYAGPITKKSTLDEWKYITVKPDMQSPTKTKANYTIIYYGIKGTKKATKQKAVSAKPNTFSLQYLPGFGKEGDPIKLAIACDNTSTTSVNYKGGFTV